MGKANSKSSTAEPRSKGLSVKCAPLARHLLPSTKFKLFNELAEQGQAKYFLKKYMRVVQRTEDAILPSSVALRGEELGGIFSLGGEPIEDDLDSSPEWWDLVERVFSNLLDTFQGKPERKWWSHVMTYEKAYGSGQFIPGDHEYRGWITEFLKGTKRTCSIGDINTGLLSVPLTLNDPSSDVKETATLAAGMLGFTLHEASVQPFQGWALLLPEDWGHLYPWQNQFCLPRIRRNYAKDLQIGISLTNRCETLSQFYFLSKP